jgi:hypothetical protein
VKSSFTVDITGTAGMRTGEWTEGEEFLILPDNRTGQEDTAARVRLLDADEPGPRADTRTDAPPAGQVTVAEVEERTERRRGAPHPVLVLRGEGEQTLCTVLPERPTTAGPRSFRVEDEHGEPLCRIVRAPSRFGRRAYWRILPADGSAPVTGHRGTWMGWVGFVLTFPVWLVFLLGSVLVSVFSLGEVSEMLVWGAPKRVTWRRRWAPPLVGNALDFRYVRSGYRWDPALLDARIAYAQAALHFFTTMHKD